MVLHPLAVNDLVRIVVAEGQRVGAVGAFILDLLDVSKKACAHVFLLGA